MYPIKGETDNAKATGFKIVNTYAKRLYYSESGKCNRTDFRDISLLSGEEVNQMARKELHIVYNSQRGGWDVKKPDTSRASSHCETKAEAVNTGREMARNQGAELITHLKNGQFQNPNNYGNDSCPPRDKKH